MNIISYVIGLNSSGGGSGGGGDAPTAEELTFTGEELANYGFSGKLADLVCSKYFDKVSFTDITKINYFGANMSNHIDFSSKTINCSSNGFSYNGVDFMFSNFSGTVLPNVISEKPLPLSGNTTGFLNNMNYVRYLPASFDNLDFSLMNNNTGWNIIGIFNGQYSLRSISPAFMSKLYNKNTDGMTPLQNISNLYVIDELVNIPLSNKEGVSTSNQFSSISNLNRIKNFTFETNNGQPYVVSWKNQTINLKNEIGYTAAYNDAIKHYLNYNSGITADKEVKDAATYEALKNNADWFTLSYAYSRYNHDSAVATINSLPDTSAYLEANGGTNTIKFYHLAGSNTDGGAINTLTEEEIAVAAAKGWTVSF